MRRQSLIYCIKRDKNSKPYLNKYSVRLLKLILFFLFIYISFNVQSCHQKSYTSPKLLSRSSFKPLISLDFVGTKLYCLRARVHCYFCLYMYIIFPTNPVRRSEELWGSPYKTCFRHLYCFKG